MKPSILSLTLGSALLAWLGAPFSAVAFSQLTKPPHFSALEIIEMSDGKTVKMKVFMDGKKVRTENVTQGSPSGMYTLILMKAQAMYMVMPGKMCMLRSLDPSTLSQYNSLQAEANQSTRIQHLGTTRLDGHPAEITLVTTKLHGGETGKIKIWSATDLQNVPLKEIVTVNGHPPVTILYKNIDLHAPDPTLFVPPTHCSSMPGMGGMGPGGMHMPPMVPKMPFSF